MLLESYSKEIFRAECNPGFEALHCFAHLDQDVGEVIPYLNAAQVTEGAKGPEDCPPLDDTSRERLSIYLDQFRFDF
jgi:hypothetical protein